MSEGMMQSLIDKIRRQYPTLTNQRVEGKGYVYIVKNREILIDVARSSAENATALTGQVTDIKHDKSGLAMMASAYNKTINNIFYIPTTKSKSTEVEKELKQIERNIKTIVQGHYNITDKKEGTTFCSGNIRNKEASSLLKKLLYDNLSPGTLKELNEPCFSFTEVLEMFNEDGTGWNKIIENQKSAQLACKLLGVRS